MVEADQTMLKVDDELAKVVKSINPSILQYCKQYFEKNLFYLYEDKLEMSVIVDAQAILSDAYSYVRNGKSSLLILMQSPFLKIYAPPWLNDELIKKIPEFSKKMKIDETQFRNAVLLLREKIIFVAENENIYNTALSRVAQSDERDVPYVQLYFSIRSHGILTKDKHLTEIPEIKTWERPGIVGKVITMFEKGALSFVIAGKGLPLVLRFLYEACALVLRGIWDVAKTIGIAIYTLLKAGVTAISKLPEWAIIGILAALIFWERGRETMTKFLQGISQGISDLLRWFYDGLKNILNLLAPLVEIGLTVMAFFFVKIEEAINMHKQINSLTSTLRTT